MQKEFAGRGNKGVAGKYQNNGFYPETKKIVYVDNFLRDIIINLFFFVLVVSGMYGIIALMSL